jgi:hypothetical protein
VISLGFKINDRVMFHVPDREGKCDGKKERGIIIDIKKSGIRNYYVAWDKCGQFWLEEKDLELIKEENKMAKEESSRQLFEVIAVNPTEEGEVVMKENVVAEDEKEAVFMSGLKEVLKTKGLKFKEVDIITRGLGTVRPYETVQKVKILGGVDGYKLVREEK